MQLKLIFVVLGCWLSVAQAEAGGQFEHRIAPILTAHCVRCHNDQQRRGELSLQTRSALRAGGESGEVVQPGDPDSSYLVDLITPVDGEAAMPKGAAPLSASEIDTVRRWIDDGAQWPAELVLEQPQWWSLRPVKRPALPQLSAARQHWTRNPIDTFIAARHAEHDFVPAVETDRRTWLRRVTFDLLGLPPTPEELRAFLADDATDAWEAAIDRLLAAPAYGERWARHWLDVVRFSESNGFEDDAPRPHAWPYRDFVIRSLNMDKPYGQFVREQLAGDVLDPVTRDSIEATGFLVAGPWDHAAAVSASATEQLRAREVMMDEMVGAISQTFMALTVNCARCHDHKFDPIPQTDYYALKAVFEGVDQAAERGLTASLILTPQEREAFERDEARIQAKLAAVRRELQQVEQQRETLNDDRHRPPLNRAVALWQFAARPQHGDAPPTAKQTAIDLKGGQSNLDGKGSLRFDHRSADTIAAVNSDQRLLDTGPGTLLKNEAGGAGYAIIPNLTGSELLPRPQTSFTLFARVRFTQPFQGVDDIFRIGSSPSQDRDTAGLEFVSKDESPDVGPAGDAAQPSTRARFVTLGKGRQPEQTVVHPHAIKLNRWYDITGTFASLPDSASGRMTITLADPNSGRQLGPAATLDVSYDTLEDSGEQEVLNTTVFLDVSYDTLEDSGVQNLLFFVAPSFRNGAQPGAQMDLAAIWHEALEASDVVALSAIEEPAHESRLLAQREREALLAALEETEAALKSRLAHHDTRLNQHRQTARKAFIGVRRPPAPTVLFLRGDIRQPGPTVAPAPLSAIGVPGLDDVAEADLSDASRRRAFANWLTHDAHPLTARVIVNRLWHYHFGRGLVDTPSDFGASGSLPSHAELLDWLAVELVSHGWSLKHIHRLILTSATYRMRSSTVDSSTRIDRTASTVDPAAIDADNRLLWRFPLRRLEAETVRDAMLAVSGDLNRQMHGPSVQPFEITRFNTYFYNLVDRDEPAYNRRTVYRMNVNTGRDPLLDALDCPAPSVMTPVRRQTTTPMQALALMNDTFALRQARRLAERVASATLSRGNPVDTPDNATRADSPRPASGDRESLRDRITLTWSLAIGRTPTETEMAMSVNLVGTSDLQTLCWTLFNSSEFLFVK